MRCLSCKYDLRKLTEHRCPECGRPFDPQNPVTFRTQRKSRLWFWLLITCVAGFVTSICLSLHDLRSSPPPTIINNVPHVQITYVQPSLTATVLRAAINALIWWPWFAAIYFVAFVCLTVVIEHVAMYIRWVRLSNHRA